MSEPALYSSGSTAQNLWQEYHIFKDRVEFHTHLGRRVIPFEKIESVKIARSDVAGLLRGDLQLKDFRPALKIDWANFVEHVVIDKSDGIRRVLFTPEDVVEFNEVLQNVLNQYHGDFREIT